MLLAQYLKIRRIRLNRQYGKKTISISRQGIAFSVLSECAQFSYSLEEVAVFCEPLFIGAGRDTCMAGFLGVSSNKITRDAIMRFFSLVSPNPATRMRCPSCILEKPD